ncbi:hypothetical protein PVIIG_06317 [Plasmodium vivax India VII]|uniref:PIR Superfamily Protein n=1 Tax=Plasmodium vivax India VII TaxID=1077284 RepID=A0A0J9S1B2_PLAVI|nr:hypothetical protein PVIIG_06317 [Plasmodium vivax India VII]
MTKPISENDLPSVKFEKDMDDLMNYSKLETLAKNKAQSDKIDSWIQTFQSNIEAYLKDSSVNLSLNNNKRCKHFNYLIKSIINKVNSLSSNPLKILEWSEKIRESRKKILLSNNNILNCNENDKYIDEDYKILGNFCEDSDFINGNLDQIQNSAHCQNIHQYMSTKKDRLLGIRKIQFTRKYIYPEIDNTCSTKNLENILLPITCNSSIERPSHVKALDLSDKDVHDEDSDEKLEIQQTLGGASFTADEQGSVTTSEGTEPSDGQSSNTFNLVTLPIIGVLGCSFIFYKNKGIIPINNDGYSTNEVMPNILNTNDIYSENTQYKISYQTL